MNAPRSKTATPNPRHIDAGPDANRSAGLQSNRVVLGVSSHEGLVELARRQSDLSEHLRALVCARKIDQWARITPAPPRLQQQWLALL